MSHHLDAIVVRDGDINPKDQRWFVRSKLDGFSLIAPHIALKRKVTLPQRRVQLATDYFGGLGSQQATYMAPNVKKYFPDKTKGGAINAALGLLGVPPEGELDRFDMIGLGKYRSNDDIEPYEPEDPEEDAVEVKGTMVAIPQEDYNELLKVFEDMAHWRTIVIGMHRAGGSPLRPKFNEKTVEEMETLAKDALKRLRKGILV